MSSSPTGLSDSPRVHWAPEVAVTVGTGAPPATTAQDVGRMMLSPFIQELEKKDKSYFLHLVVQITSRHGSLVQRVIDKHSENEKEFKIRFAKKIEAVKEYRLPILKGREAELTDHQQGLSLHELDRMRAVNQKHLARLSADMPLSDVADIAKKLEDKAQENLNIFKECLDQVPRYQDVQDNYVDVMSFYLDRLLESQVKYLTGLEDDLQFELESTVLLVSEVDKKFRSKMAAKLAAEPELSQAERTRLVKLRDQERDRLSLPARLGKHEFIVSIENHEEQSLRALKEVDLMCIKCFGLTTQLPSHYRYLGVELNSCTVMSCCEY